MTVTSDSPTTSSPLGGIRDIASFGGAYTGVDDTVLAGQALDGTVVPGLEAAPTFADDVDLDRYEAAMEQYLSGGIDAEEWRRIRLWNGVYGQRHLTDVHMIRTKTVGGALTPDALDAMADVAEHYSRGWGHITTRQNVQFHFVDVRDTPKALRRLAEAGTTTREACGDTVRTVTTCHLAGACPLEVLDVQAAAEAVTRHFLRSPLVQNLPRKFKIAASGCAVDCALTGIHDIGIMATEVDGVKGFRLYVGGGLGTDPHEAKALEPLTAPEDLLITSEAVLRVWDREMPRNRRAKTRMKFLVAKLGIEAFAEKVLHERDLLRNSAGTHHQAPQTYLPARVAVPGPTQPERVGYTSSNPEAYRAWQSTNVVAQRQPDRYAAYITLRLGDIDATQMRRLARAGRELGVHFRTTQRQNLVVRDLRAGDVGLLFDLLSDSGLEQSGAEKARNVVACPGAETCNLALTASRGVADATIDALVAAGLGDVDLSINVSGCPNSCGQQQMADIGLSGQVRRVGTDEAPGYRILLGGRVTEGGARFGQYVAKAPAKRTPEAVVTVVRRFAAERTATERFGDWVDRVGAKQLGADLADFDTKRTRADAPDDFSDWGSSLPFEVILGKGECAG